MHWKVTLTILSILGCWSQVHSFRFRNDSNIVTLTKTTDPEIKIESEKILEKLLGPTDSILQQELKSAVAEFLAETNAIDRSEHERALSFSHHHQSHRDRYNQQVTQLQQQVVSIPAVQNPPATAPISQPAPAVVPVVAPAPVQQAQPVATVPVEAARAPESVIAPTTQPAPVAPVITGQQTASVPNQVQPAPAETPTQQVVAPAPAVTPVQSVAVPAPAATPVQPAVVPAPAASPIQPVAAPAPVQPPVQQVVQIPVTVPTTTRRPRPTVDPAHALNQVDKILGNVATGNIVGIVDESLRIRAPEPVRNLVTNILKIVFCNPIDRWFRRCAANQQNAANTSQ